MVVLDRAPRAREIKAKTLINWIASNQKSSAQQRKQLLA
jgi:hypothetical protein